MGGSVPTEVPEQFKIAERFPIYALVGAYGGVFGLGLVLLLLPLYGNLLWLHLLLVPVGMALAALGNLLSLTASVTRSPGAYQSSDATIFIAH